MYSLIPNLYQHYLAHPQVTTDSRVCPPGSIFFALKGEHFDGNRYALSALSQGCSLVVVDDYEAAAEIAASGSSSYMLVPDVLTALQQLSAYHREQFKVWDRPVHVVGITGTNGKTTTKELIREVLSRRYRVLATEGNLNNQIGVPLTLLKVSPSDEIAIIEMGANHPMDIAELCELSRPDYGLITNVGKAHLQGFGSFEGVIDAKTKLYDSLKLTGGTVLIDSGNEYLANRAEGLASRTYARHGVPVAAHLPRPEVTGELLDCSPFLSLRLHSEEESIDVQTNLIGDYNLINIVAAATVGRAFGVSLSEVKEAVEQYRPTNMRSQLIDMGHGHRIILDAYNANPSSMMAALQSFSLNSDRHKCLVLGDMRELGADSEVEHRRIIDYLMTEQTFGDVLLVGSEFGKAFSSLTDAELMQLAARRSVRCYDSVDELCADFAVLDNLVGTVLVKGSRGIGLEKAFKRG